MKEVSTVVAYVSILAFLIADAARITINVELSVLA